MICKPCRDHLHSGCVGGTHCVCQHKPELGQASRNALEMLKRGDSK